MANEIKLNCQFISTDELEVYESQGELSFQMYAFDEHLEEDCKVSVYATPDDAIRFAERVIILAKEIKGVKLNDGN